MNYYITVSGNIGAGKTTLVENLCNWLGWTPCFEPQQNNPYLSDFCKDMEFWAFHSQIFFLIKRIQAHKDLSVHNGSVIQDRSIYEDATIFAYNLYKNNKINTRDYHTYLELYSTIVDFLPTPDLMIYIQVSVPTLEARIRKRGRGYETNIDPECLAQLNTLYERWTKNLTLCPVLTLQGDEMDFRADSEHLSMILEEIHTILPGTRPEEPVNRIETYSRELVYAG